MAKVTPIGFKKIVAKLVELKESQVREYKTAKDGHIYKGVEVKLYDMNDTVVRVDFARGEAVGMVFTRDRAYYGPNIWTPGDLRKLSTASLRAAKIMEEVYGSSSEI